MITKELLSEVFGEEVKGDIQITKAWDDVNGCELEWLVILFNFNTYPLDFVTHKCKEWVYTTGVTNFLSGQADHGRKCEFYYGFDEVVLYANTEPEAIFKAAQWILEQRTKNV